MEVELNPIRSDVLTISIVDVINKISLIPSEIFQKFSTALVKLWQHV